MPEIKIKHIVSFSSEDKVHKAENLLIPETYKKWKCATPGEKNASVVLQFEKATKIHSLDIGNDGSAFVEVLVGRSSDPLNNYQVLLVASSFMSPLESRTGTHTNRVRMFGPDKLAQNLKDEKWDCVQVVCTQPFNKNATYGLTFIKFHSPPEKSEEQPKEPETKAAVGKMGAFKIKYEDEDIPSVGSWFGKRQSFSKISSPVSSQDSPSYAAAVLASSDVSPKLSGSQDNILKRKHNESDKDLAGPSTKKPPPLFQINKEKSVDKDILKTPGSVAKKTSVIHVDKEKVGHKDIFGKESPSNRKTATVNSGLNSSGIQPGIQKMDKKKPFNQIMNKVVFVLSGFVNPLRSELRDKALEMGAKYRGDWNSSCTHLVCAFLNTPKYVQVQSAGGKIVTKNWILDCYKKKTLLPWKKYKLGGDEEESSDVTSESEEEPAVIVRKTAKPEISKQNGIKDKEKVTEEDINEEKSSNLNLSNLSLKNNTGSNIDSPIVIKDESETEDEDAIQDYMADTDVETNSGGDTEDEIRKVEAKAVKKDKLSHIKVDSNETDDVDSSILYSKPDTKDLPLPELPNLFKSRHFYLFGDFKFQMEHDLKRYITAYNGVIEDYMSDTIKYVITESKWDKNFEEALNENEDLIFVKPQWIFKCHEQGKLVPYQPYIVIPDT
ncbi:DNA repair protein XRCC1-like isoform X1 [Stegodyphus dumicola]|uniref:DNA repair protein XRCC1-like isoform X1 n=1 Tax=Stegodyphus dumicola TaxID=202533 RepID=UPI0015AC2904|nr:DNA repair protein XRCC1-like isoform X1 [Stegodyphus dumicola]